MYAIISILMAMVRLENVNKGFGAVALFCGISFEIQRGDRVGLIGVNGCGKTTLLRMLLGQESIDDGRMDIASGVRIAYVEQHADFDGNATLYSYALEAYRPLLNMEEELARLETVAGDPSKWNRQAELYQRFECGGGLTFRSITRSALLGLGFDDAMQARPLSSFSGGQISKASLCRALLSGADLLLLDEPTNHLDIPSIRWLECYLAQYVGAVLLISHDRAFLDAVCTKIVEIENKHTVQHDGNYSRHLELKMDERQLAAKRYQAAQKEIRRIEGIIAQQKRWNQERNYVTIASKEKQIARIKCDMVAPERDPQQIRFRFPPATPTGNDVIFASELSMRYGESKVFSSVNLDIKAGQCVCLIGTNGCGKTTLLNILSGRLAPSGGVFRIGTGVKIGYYEQNVALPWPDMPLIDAMHEAFPRMDTGELRNHMAGFLFRGADIEKRISLLSGGEKARVQLLMLLLSGCNVLLMDEPTNHLDIASAERLELALESFDGTSIIVSHDRYLVGRLADRVLMLTQDGIREQQDEREDLFALLSLPPSAVQKKKALQADENYYLRQKEHKALIAAAKQAVSLKEQAIRENEEQTNNTNAEIAMLLDKGEYTLLTALYDKLNQLNQENARLYEQLQQAEDKLNRLLSTDTEECHDF